MTLIACPTCDAPLTPATLAAHLTWGDCDEVAARRNRHRHIHPSNHQPTPDDDGAA